MSGYRNHGRHSAPTDPMMTNSYLVRARTIRDAALLDADRRELMAQASSGAGRWATPLASLRTAFARLRAGRIRRAAVIECAALGPLRVSG